jgi:hypothetical protein
MGEKSWILSDRQREKSRSFSEVRTSFLFVLFCRLSRWRDFFFFWSEKKERKRKKVETEKKMDWQIRLLSHVKGMVYSTLFLILIVFFFSFFQSDPVVIFHRGILFVCWQSYGDSSHSIGGSNETYLSGITNKFGNRKKKKVTLCISFTRLTICFPNFWRVCDAKEAGPLRSNFNKEFLSVILII